MLIFQQSTYSILLKNLNLQKAGFKYGMSYFLWAPGGLALLKSFVHAFILVIMSVLLAFSDIASYPLTFAFAIALYPLIFVLIFSLFGVVFLKKLVCIIISLMKGLFFIILVLLKAFHILKWLLITLIYLIILLIFYFLLGFFLQVFLDMFIRRVLYPLVINFIFFGGYVVLSLFADLLFFIGVCFFILSVFN